MADLVRHIGSIEEPVLGSELELRMEGVIGVNATWLELIEIGESCIESFWVSSGPYRLSRGPTLHPASWFGSHSLLPVSVLVIVVLIPIWILSETK